MVCAGPWTILRANKPGGREERGAVGVFGVRAEGDGESRETSFSRSYTLKEEHDFSR